MIKRRESLIEALKNSQPLVLLSSVIEVIMIRKMKVIRNILRSPT